MLRQKDFVSRPTLMCLRQTRTLFQVMRTREAAPLENPFRPDLKPGTESSKLRPGYVLRQNWRRSRNLQQFGSFLLKALEFLVDRAGFGEGSQGLLVALASLIFMA